MSVEGHAHYDQRIAVDAKGTIYISYMDREIISGRRTQRLRLARSHDEGRTFSVETVTTERVSDKPELVVSSDGVHIAMVYESSPGPTLIASDNGGVTWSEPRMVRPSEGRHFWPETLAVAPDGALWFAVPSMSDDDIAVGRQTPVQLHVFRSADGGRTWQDFDFGSSPRFLENCAHDPNCIVQVARISIALDSRGQAYVAYTEGAGLRQPYGLFLRSSSDAGRSWSKPQVVRGSDVLLSDRSDGATYESPAGFKTFYGHYGGVAIDASGRLHAVWGAGEPEYRTGGVWVNSVDTSDVVRR